MFFMSFFKNCLVEVIAIYKCTFFFHTNSTTTTNVKRLYSLIISSNMLSLLQMLKRNNMAASASSITSSPPSISAWESAYVGRARWVYGDCTGKSDSEHEDRAMRRAREAEKAEKMMHIICWGPAR